MHKRTHFLSFFFAKSSISLSLSFFGLLVYLFFFLFSLPNLSIFCSFFSVYLSLPLLSNLPSFFSFCSLFSAQLVYPSTYSIGFFVFHYPSCRYIIEPICIDHLSFAAKLLLYLSIFCLFFSFFSFCQSPCCIVFN